MLEEKFNSFNIMKKERTEDIKPLIAKTELNKQLNADLYFLKERNLTAIQKRALLAQSDDLRHVLTLL